MKQMLSGGGLDYISGLSILRFNRKSEETIVKSDPGLLIGLFKRVPIPRV